MTDPANTEHKPAPAPDMVTIEVDGRPMQARKGDMLIAVTDAHGVYIPRFCYHKKLTVAANCRMCLVEMEKAPKPVPACATPVADGMKFFTHSPRARSAQQATMEFLLINHPLDCPVCDQGGECELQDLALEAGGDVSRYQERKRIIKDENLGPLVATDMTRCIYCTRCVRFGTEVDGIPELGMLGRGEHSRITTYVDKALSSELSGNIIDLCPVGALTARPSRFRARPWELLAHPVVLPHDALGSNAFAHERRGEIIRVVPRDNEAVNETWLADRDRFSYEGLKSLERLTVPMAYMQGAWREMAWADALELAASALQRVKGRVGGSGLGLLASPRATVEELLLMRLLADGFGTPHIDHRLGQQDFRNAWAEVPLPVMTGSVAGLSVKKAVVLAGVNLRHEAPLLTLRLRKAVESGCKVAVLAHRDAGYRFALAQQSLGVDLVAELAGVARSMKGKRRIPEHLSALLTAVKPTETQGLCSELLMQEGAVLVLGGVAQMGPQWCDIHALGSQIAAWSGAQLLCLPQAGNSVGARLMGVVPDAGQGKPWTDMATPGYVLLDVAPEDTLDPPAMQERLRQADCVVALGAFRSESLAVKPAAEDAVRVLLPVAAALENEGTLVNMEGTWQATRAAGVSPGEARPAWKVLRVLGTQLGLAGFDFNSVAELTRAARQHIERMASRAPAPAPVAQRAATETPEAGASPRGAKSSGNEATASGGLRHVLEPAACQADALMRHAPSLQATIHARGDGVVRIHPESARQHGGITASGEVDMRQGGRAVRIWVELDERVAPGAVVSAWPGPVVMALGRSQERIELLPLAQEVLAP